MSAKLEIDYIVFPEQVVPKMSLQTILSKMNLDPHWGRYLATTRQKQVLLLMLKS
jgi:hypothetical protein